MTIRIRRHEFIAALGGSATWPLAVRAQRKPIPVIGFLGARNQWSKSLGRIDEEVLR